MSSDNGVYILISPCDDGKEGRVLYSLAIDNIYFESEKFNCDGFNPIYLVEAFRNVEPQGVYEAYFKAREEHDTIGYTEYSINIIETVRPFSYYKEKANEANCKV